MSGFDRKNDNTPTHDESLPKRSNNTTNIPIKWWHQPSFQKVLLALILLASITNFAWYELLRRESVEKNAELHARIADVETIDEAQQASYDKLRQNYISLIDEVDYLHSRIDELTDPYNTMSNYTSPEALSPVDLIEDDPINEAIHIDPINLTFVAPTIDPTGTFSVVNGDNCYIYFRLDYIDPQSNGDLWIEYSDRLYAGEAGTIAVCYRDKQCTKRGSLHFVNQSDDNLWLSRSQVTIDNDEHGCVISFRLYPEILQIKQEKRTSFGIGCSPDFHYIIYGESLIDCWEDAN